MAPLTFASYLAGRKLRQSAWGKVVTRHVKAESLPDLATWDDVRRFAGSYSGINREEVRASWSAFVRTRQKLEKRAGATGGRLARRTAGKTLAEKAQTRDTPTKG